MKVPASLSAITNEIIELELIPDQSNFSYDPAEHTYSWKLTEFSEENMEIKVTFD